MAIQSLGYTVETDGAVWKEKERISQIGLRRAILNDLSPAASFIAYNYNVSVNTDQFQQEARRLLNLFDEKYGWMYQTRHPMTGQTGRMNYVVWSDVFLCNYCQGELIFWEHGVDEGDVKDQMQCPHCRAKGRVFQGMEGRRRRRGRSGEGGGRGEGERREGGDRGRGVGRREGGGGGGGGGGGKGERGRGGGRKKKSSVSKGSLDRLKTTILT